MGPIASNLGIQFPPLFSQVLRSFSFLRLDVLPALNLDCIRKIDYIDTVLFSTLWPIGLSVFLLVLLPAIGCVCTKRTYGDYFQRLVGVFLLFTFLVYISTSSTIFSFFKCDYTFPDIDRSYLEMDYTILCDSERYKEARWFVIIMIFLYPVGIPILYFALLYRERHILIDPPPTAKRCFFRNTDGDYMVFASEQRKPPWAS